MKSYKQKYEKVKKERDFLNKEYYKLQKAVLRTIIDFEKRIMKLEVKRGKRR